MVGLGECRSANIDGLPFRTTHRQPGLLPAGYHNMWGETEQPSRSRQVSASATAFACGHISPSGLFSGRPA